MSHIEEVDVDWPWDDGFALAQAVKVGDTIYLAGQVALDRQGRVIGENDLQAQARQIFENMRTVLNKAGANFSDVVRLTNYFTGELSEESNRAYWKVRQEYFGNHRPASTGVQVKSLIYPTLLLEVDAIAVLPKSR